MYAQSHAVYWTQEYDQEEGRIYLYGSHANARHVLGPTADFINPNARLSQPLGGH